MIRSADEAPGDTRDRSPPEARCAQAASSEPDLHASEGKAAPPQLQAKFSRPVINGQSTSPIAAPESPPAPHAATPGMGSLVSDKLLTALFDLAKFAIQNVIQAALHPPAPSQDDDPSTADPWQTRVAK